MRGDVKYLLPSRVIGISDVGYLSLGGGKSFGQTHQGVSQVF